MFAKIALVACVIGLGHCGGLQNYGIGGYGGFGGYAPSYSGYRASYPGYGSGYPGYGAGYAGYGSNLYGGLNAGVATSYVNFNKYTSPRYDSYSGINGLPYGSGPLYGATSGLYGGYNNLEYGGYDGAGLGYVGYPGYGYGGYNNAHNNIW
ncbi:hypothetical protein ACJJTC_019317 [Scirpophaga incertulas]